MKFNILTSEMTTGELMDLEDTPSFSGYQRVMAKFMVDETTNERIPYKKAIEILRALTVEENQQVQIAFMESFRPNPPTAAQ